MAISGLGQICQHNGKKHIYNERKERINIKKYDRNKQINKRIWGELDFTK